MTWSAKKCKNSLDVYHVFAESEFEFAVQISFPLSLHFPECLQRRKTVASTSLFCLAPYLCRFVLIKSTNCQFDSDLRLSISGFKENFNSRL